MKQLSFKKIYVPPGVLVVRKRSKSGELKRFIVKRRGYYKTQKVKA